jgi:hypothetical protein
MVTNKVLDLRKERELRTKEVINFWSLAAARSAHIMPEGEVFACVEFRDSPAAEPQAYTINLSGTPRIGKTSADFMPAGSIRAEQPPTAGEQADLVWYLYPLPEAQKGCINVAGESDSPATALKIETVHMQREEQWRLPAILMSAHSGSLNEARVIEVSFSPETSDPDAQPASKKWGADVPSGAKDFLLVYLAAAEGGEKTEAIGVSGAFEPGSEWVNPYSLLVVPAVAGDVVIDAAIILLGAAAFGGWACGR